MYIESYWGSYVGGTDDSLTLLSLLEDFEKDEIGLGEIFARTGLKALEERESSLRMTGDALRFTNREGMELNFYYAIDLIGDLAALYLECLRSGSVNLRDLDEGLEARNIRLTASCEEKEVLRAALSDFAEHAKEYDITEVMDETSLTEFREELKALRRELFES